MAREFSKSFYNSKEWGKVRDSILKRDHYLCRQCGEAHARLEVHHITRLTESNIGNPKITMAADNLITLCRDCHFKEHEQDKLAGVRAKVSKDICSDKYKFDSNGYLIPG